MAAERTERLERSLHDGRYRLERVLGTGGMATVWLGCDRRLDRRVAIKVMADTLAADAAYVSRFEREARIAASLSHSGLVDIFDFSSEDERPFLVMEYISGGTLNDRMRSGAEPPALGALGRELLAALAHVHGAGIVHRDIKPANVLVDEYWRYRLTDFGIAHPDDATHLTMTGQVIGTLKYLAPEVVRGAKASPRSDLYACGVLLSECGGVDRRLARLIERLAAPALDQRPPSAEAALEELEAVLGDREQPAGADRIPTRRPEASGETGRLDSTAETGRLEPTGETGRLDTTAETAPLEATAETGRLAAGELDSAACIAPSAPPRPPAHRRFRRRLAAALGLLGAGAVVLTLVLSGGRDSSPQRPPPRPASPDAGLQRQLDALERIVREAPR